MTIDLILILTNTPNNNDIPSLTNNPQSLSKKDVGLILMLCFLENFFLFKEKGNREQKGEATQQNQGMNQSLQHNL